MLLSRRLVVLLLLASAYLPAQAQSYVDAIRSVREAVVGIGIVTPTENPPFRLLGTGFAAGDGLWIITSAHIVPQLLNQEKRERLALFQFSRDGATPALKVTSRPVEVRKLDRERDIAILRIQGAPLPALELQAKDALLSEGSPVLFSGYALGQSLGVTLTTHRGMISAVTPAVLAIPGARGLAPNAIRALRNTPFQIYQLDATAFPGHSGSPIYDPETREVVAIISGGQIKGNREMAITHPSGITYAIPIQYVREVLQGMEK